MHTVFEPYFAPPPHEGASTVSVKTGRVSRSRARARSIAKRCRPRRARASKYQKTHNCTPQTGANLHTWQVPPAQLTDGPSLNPPAAFFMHDRGRPLPKRACDGLSSPQTNSTGADAPCSEALVQPSSPICASNVVVGPTQLPSAAPAAASAPEVLLSFSDHFQHCNVKQLRAMVMEIKPYATAREVNRMNRAELLEHLALHSIEHAISGGGAVASHEPR